METIDIETEATATVKNERFEFTGKAVEYFSIWIVNVALTILTLGIYSAWAKVRTNQYFYGNTLLDGASFRYLADPKQILKGRIIAFAVFMLYYFASLMSPIVAGGMMAIIMLLVPALIVMSMSFRLRNSAYRNVRFNFDKNFKRAYAVFLIPVLFIGAYIFFASQFGSAQAAADAEPEIPVLMLLLLAAISLMFPWWEYMITQFKVEHSGFGEADFSFFATIKNYYGMYLKMFIVMFVVIMIMALAMGVLIPMFASEEEPGIMAVVMPLLIMFMILPAYLWMFAYMQTKRTNLVYGNLHIDGHQVKSELKTAYMMYLYFTNTLAMMFTLGLLMPWAKIRTAKYKASVTSIDVAGNLSQFTASQAEHQTALGEEMGEMFDIDLGF